MFEENKFMIITAGIVTVSIIAVFAFIFFALPSNNATDEEKAVFLDRNDSYVKGNPNAKAEVVVFEDFQCPACASYQPAFQQLIDEQGDNVKFVFRHFPLTNIHRNAYISSLAAEAAGAQGKFYEYHDILFAKQSEWQNLSGDELMNKFTTYATEAGVSDIEKFKLETEGQTYKAKVDRDTADANALGVSATPTVFVNGKKIGNPVFERLNDEVNSINGK